MTIRELLQRVGRTGLTGKMQFHAIHIHVRIVDCREAFGRTDYLIEPLAGDGQQWVSADRVSSLAEGQP